MKKYILLLVLGFALNANGQDSTQFLVSSKPLKIRLQAAAGYEGSFLNRTVIHTSGLDLGLLFNKRFYLGGYLFTSLNSPENVILTDPANGKGRVTLTTIGVRTGYHFRPYKAIHLATNVQLGSLVLFANTTDGNYLTGTTTAITPSVETELNLTRCIKLGIGVGYRFASKKDIFFIQNEIRSVVYNVTLRFGRFAR